MPPPSFVETREFDDDIIRFVTTAPSEPELAVAALNFEDMAFAEEEEDDDIVALLLCCCLLFVVVAVAVFVGGVSVCAIVAVASLRTTTFVALSDNDENIRCRHSNGVSMFS